MEREFDRLKGGRRKKDEGGRGGKPLKERFKAGLVLR